jgi:hypothetical protein
LNCFQIQRHLNETDRCHIGTRGFFPDTCVTALFKPIFHFQ